ncbi:PSD1 and planctomycete cytochrome C domain-containing protein [Roseiconus lacunae]|uniref:PSD1 and planctomycete cytochrome C domain-containing protein n=1 Tax=Roseiconus lacunae TaxID=2605694 RepID=A0ABT7PMG5_9BACT|nr:PSD1 and planctomycete cytochrome C domain-containing protein [Roseiconus lacunae]MDM4017676.1 PSD1 and planctomycete cytochrome C domain-containing protein [Roseiconus lacunae]
MTFRFQTVLRHFVLGCQCSSSVHTIRTFASALVAIGTFVTITHPRLAKADTPTASKLTAEQETFFETKVRPLLIDRCYECHSEEAGESSGGLRLDNAAVSREGGASGPAIVPGDVDASLLIEAINYENVDYQMPPEGKLEDAEIATLRTWIEMGAPDPRTDKNSSSKSTSPMDIDPQSHWAFVPPMPAPHHTVMHRDDHDVIDSLAREIADQAGLAVSPPVDDEQMIRRLYYDLVGLPPTLEQIQTFVQSDSADKVERLADQLIASPDYGERIARYWMDVARYADTIGYALAGKDRRLKGSERYRDWLIDAFAQDMPFDQMVRLQLAADRIDPDNANGNLDAMGFLTIGRRYLNGYDTIDDRIDVITRGLLGLTVACARCHDHKFDPIPTKDYYSLLGIIQSSEAKEDGPSPLMLVDKETPSDSHVFLRGQPGNRGDIAPRQYLTALRSNNDTPFSDGSGRKELAERIADENNPLFARVFVNRLWMKLIGRPFVDSTSDFGVRTEAPPSVKILDELAADFSQHWSVKRLVRRIVTSRIYAQSATTLDQNAFDVDPDNRYLARGNRRRRDFESLRDSLTFVSGQLDRQVGGAPVEIHLERPVSRRTLYAMIDRQNLPSMFRTFDMASPDSHAPKRYLTTVPQQALFLMNHPQIGILANHLAGQLRQQHADAEQQAIEAFRQIYARSPSNVELQAAVAYLAEPVAKTKPSFDSRLAWRYGTSPANDDGRVDQFTELKKFVGAVWQDADQLPSESELGYASLGKENGHPGRRHSVVRRWTVPADGEVTLEGRIRHSNDKGDGVQLAIWANDELLFRESKQNGTRSFEALRTKVHAGETVDFVISPQASDSFDSFNFRCSILLEGDDGELYQGNSMTDFSGPVSVDPIEPLDRLGQLVQAMLISNEFAFVD